MDKVKKEFEERFIKGTCFDNFDDLMNDETSVLINIPRVLIAVNLRGVWTGFKERKKQIEQLEAEKFKAIKIAKEFHSYIDAGGPREYSEINQLWLKLKALENK